MRVAWISSAIAAVCVSTVIDNVAAQRPVPPSGSPYSWKLLGALNPDGSGSVHAMNDKNWEVVFDLAAGTGAREIKFHPPYSFCVWTWNPVPAKS
jgi:hypothetical protein